MQYQTLIEAIRELADVPDNEAARAAAATVGALTHVLPRDDRQRLADRLPGKIRNAVQAEDAMASQAGRREDPSGFVADIAGRCGCGPEDARLRAQATLSVLAEHEPDLFPSLPLPDGFDELLTLPLPGGGLVSPTGKTPQLSDDELRRAAENLPDWTVDEQRLTRTVLLPPENARALLPHLEQVLRDAGRPGHVEPTDDGLRIELWTRSVRAVTQYDVDAARSVEEMLRAVGPMISSPGPSATTPAGTWSRSPEVLFGEAGLHGWRMSGRGTFDTVGNSLDCREGPGLLWYADHDFADCTLTLDWRLFGSDDRAAVVMRFPDPGNDPAAAAQQGWEVDLSSEATGSLLGVGTPFAVPAFNPSGEWNHLELQAYGVSCRVGINGRQIASYRTTGPLTGHIGVYNRDESCHVQYRDIWVFDAPSAPR